MLIIHKITGKCPVSLLDNCGLFAAMFWGPSKVISGFFSVWQPSRGFSINCAFEFLWLPTNGGRGAPLGHTWRTSALSRKNTFFSELPAPPPEASTQGNESLFYLSKPLTCLITLEFVCLFVFLTYLCTLEVNAGGVKNQQAWRGLGTGKSTRGLFS